MAKHRKKQREPIALSREDEYILWAALAPHE